MTDRQIILNAVIKVLVVVVTTFLVPAIKGWLDRNKENKELQIMLAMASIAVKSVENDLRNAGGAAKMEEALARLVSQMDRIGLKGFTVDELKHYIETACVALWNEQGVNKQENITEQ